MKRFASTAALGGVVVACGGGAPSPVGTSITRPLSTEVSIEAGEFTRGRNDSDRPDEVPAHRVRVHAFHIDATLVTRRAFLAFADEAHYVTTAERDGYGIGAYEGMNDWEWERMPGASVRRPFKEDTPGTEAFLAEEAPAVMVSWDDAVAFCKHHGKRLPTEAEWEYAMRAGAIGTRYPWGEEPVVEGRYRLNFWQGISHRENLRSDGFVYTSPVRAYPPNAWGIYDAVGNVWQWTADGYAADTYALSAKVEVAVDPRGAAEPFPKKRVLRGGSWWCGACTCEGNGLHYRGKAEPRAAFNNNGFRCARW